VPEEKSSPPSHGDEIDIEVPKPISTSPANKDRQRYFI